MLEKFREIRLSPDNKSKLKVINSIIEDYKEQGYTLTLRQLYYQLVSKDLIPNSDSEYKKISKLLKEGRMAGEVDWDAIEDRLRVPYLQYYSSGIEDAVNDTINQYKLDRQKGQNTYLEVWVEKDALSGVLRRVTDKYHIRLLVNRGYGSVTAMHDCYNRIYRRVDKGIPCTILYLGDHDPSGIDMLRDIKDRVTEMLVNSELIDYDSKFEELSCEAQNEYRRDYEDQDLDTHFVQEMAVSDYANKIIGDLFSIEPIALTMEQIEKYNPPKNPAKLSDTRSKSYIDKYGSNSWEVDALNPQTLNTLLSSAVECNLDMDKYNSMLSKELSDKEKLKSLLK